MQFKQVKQRDLKFQKERFCTKLQILCKKGDFLQRKSCKSLWICSRMSVIKKKIVTMTAYKHFHGNVFFSQKNDNIKGQMSYDWKGLKMQLLKQTDVLLS